MRCHDATVKFIREGRGLGKAESFRFIADMIHSEKQVLPADIPAYGGQRHRGSRLVPTLVPFQRARRPLRLNSLERHLGYGYWKIERGGRAHRCWI